MQRQEKPFIYQWHGIQLPEQLAEECTAVIDKLVNGPRNALHFEYLHGYDDLITVRLNQKRRLLLTTVEKNGQRLLVVCGVLDNHKHAEHYMMQKGVLETFRKRHAERLNLDETKGIIPEERFITIDHQDAKIPAPLAAADKTTPIIKTAYFNKTKFIELNAEQAQIAEKQVRFPVVVLGDAGSGKSCIVSAFLLNYAKNFLDDDEKLTAQPDHAALPVLCVAKSARVRAFLEHNWKLSPISPHYTRGQVVFRDYESLINELAPEVSQFKKVGEDEFNDYFKRVLVSKIKKAKTTKKNTLSTELLNQQENVYREFRIISGCQTLARYKELGKKQSLFRKACDIEWLYAVYQEYMSYLQKHQLVDFAFYQLPLKIKAKYQRVIVDEAQDFSWCELANLYQLALDRQIGYCLDEKQSLTDPLPKLSYLQWLLDAQAGKMQIVKLNTTYRSGTAIMKVANVASELGDHFALQQKDRSYGEDAAEHQGQLEVMTDLSSEKLDVIREIASSSLFAVITTSEYLDEAKGKFEDEIVLTIEAAKGLEFDFVLAYRIMDNKTFYAANDAINQKATPNVHYAVAFNAVYTTCTRAISHLIIYEKEKHKLRHLLAKVSKEVVGDNTDHQATIKRTTEEIAEKLFEQFKKLIIEGDVIGARELGENKKLQLSKDDVERYITDLSIKQEDRPSKPLPPAVVSNHALSAKQNNNHKKPTPTHSPTFFGQPTVPVGPYLKIEKERFEALVTKEHLSREDIDFLFGKRNTDLILFNVPLQKSGECLFTLLLDRFEVRSIIINDYLLKYFDELVPIMPASVFNRKKGKDKNNKPKMPSIFWMTFYEKFTRRLIDSKHLAGVLKKVTHQALTATLTEEGSEHNGYSALYFLTCFAPYSMTPLLELKKNHFSFSMVTPEQFYKRSPNIYSQIWHSSLFDNLMYASDSSRQFLLTVMRENRAFVENFSLPDMFARPIGMNDARSSFCDLRKNKYVKEIMAMVDKDSRRMELVPPDTYSDDEITRLNKVITPDMLEVCQSLAFIEKVKNLFVPGGEIKALYSDLREGLSNPKTAKSVVAALFMIPVKHDDAMLNNECWFFQLMSTAETAPVMMKLILEKPQLFGFTMTASALCGSKNMPAERMTPWVQMMLDVKLQPILADWVERNHLLAKTIPLWALFAPMKWEKLVFEGVVDHEGEDVDILRLMEGNSYTTFQLFSLYHAGWKVIKHVMKDKCRLHHYLTPELFTVPYLETANTGFQMNLLKCYLPDPDICPEVIDMLIREAEAEVKMPQKGVKSTFARVMQYLVDTSFEMRDGKETVIHEVSNIGRESLISYLLMDEMGLELVIFFIRKSSAAYQDKLIKLFFAPFMAETPDTSRWVDDLITFNATMADEKQNGIYDRFMTALLFLLDLDRLQSQTTIKLDKTMFAAMDERDKENVKNKMIFVNSLCATKQGKAVYNKICWLASRHESRPDHASTMRSYVKL